MDKIKKPLYELPVGKPKAELLQLGDDTEDEESTLKEKDGVEEFKPLETKSQPGLRFYCKDANGEVISVEATSGKIKEVKELLIFGIDIYNRLSEEGDEETQDQIKEPENPLTG